MNCHFFNNLENLLLKVTEVNYRKCCLYFLTTCLAFVPPLYNIRVLKVEDDDYRQRALDLYLYILKTS